MGQSRVATGLILLSTSFLSPPQSQSAPHARQNRLPSITALTASPDGAGYLFGSQSGVFCTEPGNEPKQAFATELDHVHHLAFSPDGAILAVAGGSPAEDGAVELW